MLEQIKPYIAERYMYRELFVKKPQILYLVRGSSGSGKSTVANTIRNYLEIEVEEYVNPFVLHLETDARFYDAEGNYNFDASKLSEYHKGCLDATKVSLENGYTVIVSNTFTSEWELEPYVNLAKSMDIPVQIITVQSNFKSIHNVPAETLQKQKARMKSCDMEKLLND
jgi:predicted kinase